MKSFVTILFFSLTVLPVSVFSQTVIDSKFIDENSSHGGISLIESQEILERVQNVYTPIFQSRGFKINLRLLWDEAKDNAQVSVAGSSFNKTKIANFFGGLARNQFMTFDAFTLIACHEIGHMMNGAPNINSFFGGGIISSEGQADYFSTLQCAKLVWDGWNPITKIAERTIPDTYLKLCQTQFNSNSEILICERSIAAAIQVAKAETQSSNEPIPDINNLDLSVTQIIFGGYPSTSCRLATRIAGALCNKSPTISLDEKNPNIGACSRLNGDLIGIRPDCWYADYQPKSP